MRYVSIFSGVEAATLAWEPLGWEPVAFSEIEPFPCAVLAERWPDVPNLGDITKSIGKRRFMEQLTLWSEEVHASPSPSQESEKGSKARPASCSSTFDAYRNFVLDGFFGKTSRERSQARMGTLSDNCSEKWMSSGIVSHGEYWTRNSSEWPSDAAVCFLSDILEPNPPQRFSLSPTACRGFLNRAAKRGRSLPAELDAALRAQALSTSQLHEQA